MAGNVKPIPEGYHSITASLTCRNAARAIDFYKQAFGAQEKGRMAMPDGKIGHAELKIGDSVIFVNDEMGPAATVSSGAAPIYLYLYVPDVDATYKRAVAAGAHADMPVTDMFWGDRYGKLTDPFGHQWGIATHIEDLAGEEIEKRARAFFAKTAGQG